MINPSELEGEVDHSFFDSDCNSSSEHEKKKVEKDGKGDKKSPPVPERAQIKPPENRKGDLPRRTDERERHLNQLQRNNISSSKAGKKESSRASSLSSAGCIPHKAVTDSSDSENDFDLHSKRPKEKLLATMGETTDGDGKDVSSHSPNETEEEAGDFNKTSKKRFKHSSKELPRNQRTRSPSLSSSETSADADIDSSCSSSSSSSSSSSRRSSLESPTLPKPNTVLCAGERSTRASSAESQQTQTALTDESDYTVTDVSPLASPDSSPFLSLDCNHNDAEVGGQEDQQEETVPSSGLSNIHEEEDSDQGVDECSLSLESQLRDKLVVHYPGGRNRKNYSFTNDEVRRIDRENQRLLRELSRISPGPRSGSAMTKKSLSASGSPLVRLSHSALNRQREQQRIERENLSFLKRLQSVKPTPGLSRSDQLTDYHRHAGYLGTMPYPLCSSTTKHTRASSRTSSGSRSLSSRAAFSASDSSRTPVPTPRKVSAARPAWC